MSEEVGRSWKMFQVERTVFVRPWAKTEMVFSEKTEFHRDEVRKPKLEAVK